MRHSRPAANRFIGDLYRSQWRTPQNYPNSTTRSIYLHTINQKKNTKKSKSHPGNNSGGGNGERQHDPASGVHFADGQEPPSVPDQVPDPVPEMVSEWEGDQELERVNGAKTDLGAPQLLNVVLQGALQVNGCHTEQHRVACQHHSCKHTVSWTFSSSKGQSVSAVYFQTL